MMQRRFSHRSRFLGLTSGLAMLLAAVAAAPASADLGSALATAPTTGVTSVDTSACTNPLLTQPFTWAGDSNWYTLVPGQSPGQFAGDGWTLGGGARITPTTLADGQSSTVLDLPSGAYAVSPYICVTSAFPTARTMVAGAQGVMFTVSYKGSVSGVVPQWTSQISGRSGSWSLSDPVNVNPSNRPGWQIVRFGFQATGINGDSQLYDFYVDPRMKP